METCSSIECHNDEIKTHVFCGSNVRNLTLTQRSAFDLAAVKWPSKRVTVKAICHKYVVDLKITGPLTVWRRLLFRSGDRMTCIVHFQNGNTVNFRLVVQKCNIEFQIDQSHSAKMSGLPNAIGQFTFQYCVLWTTNLKFTVH